MTFNECIENATIIRTNIFGDNVPEWLDIYPTYHIELDRYFKIRYGNKELIEELTNRAELTAYIDMYLLTNRTSLDRLWENYNANYNPVENYDRYEDLKDNYGKVINTDTIGDVTSTNINDKLTSKSVSSVYPTDSNILTEQSEIETTSSGTGENGKSVNTSTINEHTNTTTTAGTNDDESRTDTHINHIHGNIGVTQASEMINSNIALWSSFSFYDILYSGIINECTIGIWR